MNRLLLFVCAFSFRSSFVLASGYELPEAELQNSRLVNQIWAPGEASIVVGRAVDLNLLGPGTNVAVNITVIEDAYNRGLGNYDLMAWCISNGRFDGARTPGEVRVTERLPRLGKYPWPVDAQMNFLPGSRLRTSNTTHAAMRVEVSRSYNTRGHSRFRFGIDGWLSPAFQEHFNQINLSGNIQIQPDGTVAIGYVSSQNEMVLVNGRFTEELEGLKALGVDDARLMHPRFRQMFHDKISSVAKGRNLAEVAKAAPSSAAGVKAAGAFKWFKLR